MMFLQYSVPAAIYPAFSYYLMYWLHFGSGESGIIMAMPGLAAWVAPIAASYLTGRHISAERLLSLCCGFTAASLFLLYKTQSFWPVLIAYFFQGLFFAPTFGLTNTVTMHHLSDPARDFGGIRMWGTIGWCVVAWLFGYLYLRVFGGSMPHAILVSATIALLLTFYVLRFKPVETEAPEGGTKNRGMLWRLLARPDMRLLCIVTLLNGVGHQYYYFGAAPFLHQQGFPDHYIIPAMSLGQTAEFILLGLLGRCIARLGMKRTMVVGVLAQALRMAIFAYEGPWWLTLLGLSLHGICYAFFFTTAYLYLDRHSTPQTRAAGQQLLTAIMSGCGPVLGFILAGLAARWLPAPDGDIHFQPFWLIPVPFFLLITFWLGRAFPTDHPEKTVVP